MRSLEMNLGLALFKTSEFAEAIKAFDAAQESSRRSAHHHPAGHVHYGMGNYLVAIPYLKEATEHDPREHCGWARSRA